MDFFFYIFFGCFAGSNSWVVKTSCYPIPDFKEKGSLSRMYYDMLFCVWSQTWQEVANDVWLLIDIWLVRHFNLLSSRELYLVLYLVDLWQILWWVYGNYDSYGSPSIIKSRGWWSCWDSNFLIRVQARFVFGLGTSTRQLIEKDPY